MKVVSIAASLGTLPVNVLPVAEPPAAGVVVEAPVADSAVVAAAAGAEVAVAASAAVVEEARATIAASRATCLVNALNHVEEAADTAVEVEADSVAAAVEAAAAAAATTADNPGIWPVSARIEALEEAPVVAVLEATAATIVASPGTLHVNVRRARRVAAEGAIATPTMTTKQHSPACASIEASLSCRVLILDFA